jgi:predicted secreted protein
MKITSMLAIYFLFWFLCLFVVLPFGVRTTEEEGETVQRGHADSAPHRFNVGRAVFRTTLLASALFALFYLNYLYGWVGIDDLDFAH